ncbi:hypothetical protein Tco_0313809 [Tanacetum coccineum]
MKNGRMMLDSIDEGPLVYPTVVGEDGQTRRKKYSELTEAQQLQDDYDVQATNIIHTVFHLILYNLFDKFASIQGETLYEYYWRFSQLINDMHTIGMTMQQVQVNTNFLNALPSEWRKFVTDVKLAMVVYPTHDQYPDPLALVANSQTLYNPSQSPQHSVPSMHPSPQQFTPAYAAPIHHQHSTPSHSTELPQLDYGLAVPTFQQGEDPIDYINKAMAFLSAVASRFPYSNNQLITSSNSKNQATIQDGRVTVQHGEGHMAKQCTQPKRPINSAWFKEKLMLFEAQEAGQILDEEQLAFIADPGIVETQVAQQTIPQNSAFQTEDLDAYDSDYDAISLAKAVLMANLSICDSNVLSEVPYSDTYLNDIINQDVQEMLYSEQTHIVDFPDNKITSDSNIIPYSQYLIEAPSELLKVSLVNESLKKLKYHLASFDKVVKKRTTSDAISADVWAAGDQYSVDKNALEIQIKQLHIDNDQLLTLITSQEIMHIAVNSVDILDVSKSCVDECNKCLELETELFKKKDLI